AEVQKHYHAPDLFFFFQAEDGIRDLYVTGVQTCALPIYHLHPLFGRGRRADAGGWPRLRPRICLEHWCCIWRRPALRCRGPRRRSEERRVGKEWRPRWGREPEKKQR